MMEYPWYELLEDSSDITQGDIIKQCPVPMITDLTDVQTGQKIKAEIEYVNGIILTQACDIANDKVENVILCSVTSKEEFEKQLKENGKTPKDIKNSINGIIKGQQNAYHIINNYMTDSFAEDYYIINFKDIFSVPVHIAKNVAKSNGKRL